MSKITLYRTVSGAFLIITALVGFASCDFDPVPDEPPETVLWYDEPAAEWTEALPVGNGRLGAMVFGDPVHERIQLNEESVWCRKDSLHRERRASHRTRHQSHRPQSGWIRRLGIARA
ncbi:MAG: glycoside hydrolase N-terminal domain-containing protein, partial [Bacteroidales bacterium]